MTRALPVPVFLSFAYEDRRYAQELRSHMAMLARLGVAELLVAEPDGAGESRRSAALSMVDRAAIIVILASAQYLASPDCFEGECRRAVEREAAGLAMILPVRLRTCDFQSAPFSHLAALPQDGRAVAEQRNRDRCWIEVLTAIRAASQALPDRSTPTPLPVLFRPNEADASDKRLHPPTRIFPAAPITDLVRRRTADVQPTNLVAFGLFQGAARLAIEAEGAPGGEAARVKLRAAGRELLDCIECTLYVRFDRLRLGSKSAPAWTQELEADEAGALLLDHLAGERYPSLKRIGEWLVGPRALPSGVAARLQRSLGIAAGLPAEIARIARLQREIATARPIAADDVAHLEWVARSLLDRRLHERPTDAGLPRVDDPR
ncbi:MAG: toll/interleukin-1 receptor domain-containing protein [Polyangiaceae bacterium]